MTNPPAIAPDPLTSLPPLLRWLLLRTNPSEDALALVHPGVTAESLYEAFVKGELVCALAPGRIAALVTRPEDLDGAADRLRVYLRRNPALVRVPSVVWSEAVPPRSRVRRFVDDLTAATLG